MQVQFTVTKIESSLIRGIDYTKGILTVDLGKSLYSYYKVPASVALAMISSDSLGRFYNECIKDEYDFRQLQSVTDSFKVVAA